MNKRIELSNISNRKIIRKNNNFIFIDDQKPRKDINKTKILKEKTKQILMQKNTIHIFSDGSSLNNPGPCGAGIVLIFNDYRKEFSIPLGYGTNNFAELSAIKYALKKITSKKWPIIIYTDSKYCIGVLTQNWKIKANRELILEIKDLIDDFGNVKFQKVKGHCGIKDNVRADKLAGDASKISKEKRIIFDKEEKFEKWLSS